MDFDTEKLLNELMDPSRRSGFPNYIRAAGREFNIMTNSERFDPDKVYEWAESSGVTEVPR